MLPDMDCGLYLTDAGIETTLIFLENVPLRDFAAFELIETEEGRERLKRYYRRHAAIAAAHGAGFVFRGADLAGERGLGRPAGLRRRRPASDQWTGGHLDAGAARYPCAGDGPAGRGERHHRTARRRLRPARDDDGGGGRDLPPPPGPGPGRGRGRRWRRRLRCPIRRKAIRHRPRRRRRRSADRPLVHDRDRRPVAVRSIPGPRRSGRSMPATGQRPLYYMINCAHPDHFRAVLDEPGPWRRRVRALRANASRMSHAELDAAETLDDGDPVELGALYAALRHDLPLAVAAGRLLRDRSSAHRRDRGGVRHAPDDLVGRTGQKRNPGIGLVSRAGGQGRCRVSPGSTGLLGGPRPPACPAAASGNRRSPRRPRRPGRARRRCRPGWPESLLQPLAHAVEPPEVEPHRDVGRHDVPGPLRIEGEGVLHRQPRPGAASATLRRK